MAKNFFTTWVLEPLDNLTFAVRNVLDKMGILDPIDTLIYKGIEDPIVYALFTKLYDFKAYNTEVIPKEGPALFAFNHTSLIDPIVAGLSIVHNSRRIPYQLAKAELVADPLLQNFTRLNKAIYIRRGDSDELAMKICKEKLNEDELLIIFPEGTISDGNGKMLPFKTGIVRLAYETEVPIIPVAIYGTDKVYGKKMKFPASKGKIRVKFGKPLTPQKLFKGKLKSNQDQDVTGPEDLPNFEKIAKKVQREVNKLWTDLWTEDQESKSKKNN